MINQFKGKYEFLSNFYPCTVRMDGLIYPSVEHAYQAMKTADMDERINIQRAKSPGEARRRGQKVQIRPNWEHVKVGIMNILVRKKFENPELADKLKATGQQRLVEGNHWHDYFWGVCDGRGLNKLGEILMQVRSEL